MAKPAPTTAPQIKVNLLHPQGVPLKLPQKFMSWLTSYGRFIVIIVEIIVLSCFAYRFKLDADLDNLKKDITEQIDIRESHQADQALIKQTQQKLQLINQTYDSNPEWEQLLKNIASKVPTTASFNNFSVEHQPDDKNVQFKITAHTTNPNDIVIFVNALKELDKNETDRYFKDINVSGMSYDTGTITFSITGASNIN